MDAVNNYGEWLADVRIKAAGHIFSYEPTHEPLFVPKFVHSLWNRHK